MCADDFARVFTTCLDMTRERASTAPAEARAMMECYGYLLRGCLQIQLKEITVNEAARLAGKSPSEIRQMIAKRELTARGGDGALEVADGSPRLGLQEGAANREGCESDVPSRRRSPPRNGGPFSVPRNNR